MPVFVACPSFLYLFFLGWAAEQLGGLPEEDRRATPFNPPDDHSLQSRPGRHAPFFDRKERWQKKPEAGGGDRDGPTERARPSDRQEAPDLVWKSIQQLELLVGDGCAFKKKEREGERETNISILRMYICMYYICISFLLPSVAL